MGKYSFHVATPSAHGILQDTQEFTLMCYSYLCFSYKPLITTHHKPQNPLRKILPCYINISQHLLSLCTQRCAHIGIMAFSFDICWLTYLETIFLALTYTHNLTHANIENTKTHPPVSPFLVLLSSHPAASDGTPTIHPHCH